MASALIGPNSFAMIPFKVVWLSIHNLYLQLFASSGILGLFGLVLVLILLGSSWKDAREQLDPLTSRAGQLMLAYTLIQGCFDLSLLHWPMTLVVTGLALGIPLSVSPQHGPSSVLIEGLDLGLGTCDHFSRLLLMVGDGHSSAVVLSCYFCQVASFVWMVLATPLVGVLFWLTGQYKGLTPVS